MEEELDPQCLLLSRFYLNNNPTDLGCFFFLCQVALSGFFVCFRKQSGDCNRAGNALASVTNLIGKESAVKLKQAEMKVGSGFIQSEVKLAC